MSRLQAIPPCKRSHLASDPTLPDYEMASPCLHRYGSPIFGVSYARDPPARDPPVASAAVPDKGNDTPAAPAAAAPTAAAPAAAAADTVGATDATIDAAATTAADADPKSELDPIAVAYPDDPIAEIVLLRKADGGIVSRKIDPVDDMEVMQA